jgi:predicted ribosome quality control (RQC) complex YloA/Tae2 family protein
MFELNKAKMLLWLKKKQKALKKAQDKAIRSLKEAQDSNLAFHEAELLKAHFHLLSFGMKEVTVYDWEKDNAPVHIPLDVAKTPQENVEALFKKSRKLKRAASPLEAYIAKIASQLHETEKMQVAVEKATCLEELPPMVEKERASSLPEKSLPYRRFVSKQGIEILVGKNSESNHQLTFHIARGNDLWLHIHSFAGSHVIVRKEKNKPIDNETLQDALQLAAYFSKVREKALYGVEVLVTEKKYVTRQKQFPKGKVAVSQYKLSSVFLDKQRVLSILGSH